MWGEATHPPDTNQMINTSLGGTKNATLALPHYSTCSTRDYLWLKVFYRRAVHNTDPARLLLNMQLIIIKIGSKAVHSNSSPAWFVDYICLLTGQPNRWKPLANAIDRITLCLPNSVKMEEKTYVDA